MKKQTFAVKRSVFAVTMAMASLSASAAAPTISYGSDAWYGRDSVNSGSFISKLQSDTAQLYVLAQGVGGGGGYTSFVATKVGADNVIDYSYRYGSSGLFYIKEQSVYHIFPSTLYGGAKDGANQPITDQLAFNQSAVKRYSLSQYPGIEKADAFHYGGNAFLWVTNKTLYSSTTGFGYAPNSQIITTDVLETKSFGNYFFVKTSTGVYVVTGYGQTVLVRIDGETTLDFLKDFTKSQIVHGAFFLQRADGSFSSYNTYGTGPSGKKINYSLKGNPGVASYQDNSGAEVIGSLFQSNTPWSLPSNFINTDVKRILGIIQNPNSVSTVAKVGDQIVAYITTSGKLKLVPVNQNGSSNGSMSVDWVADYTKAYISADLFDENYSGYVGRLTGYYWGIDGYSGGSNSPKLIAAGYTVPNGWTPATAYGSLLGGGYHFLNGKGDAYRIMYDHDNDNWTTQKYTAPTGGAKFSALNGQNSSSYFSIDDVTGSANNVYMYTNINVVTGTVTPGSSVSQIIDGAKYKAFKDSVAAGSVLYAGVAIPYTSVVEISSGNLVSSGSAMGLIGASSAPSYAAINEDDWRTVIGSLTNVQSPFAALGTDYTATYMNYSDNAVAMSSDGSLRFTGGMGNSSNYLKTPTNSYLQWGFDKPTEIPLDSGSPPANVKATKGDFNDKVDISWTIVGSKNKYTIKRGLGAGVSTIAANLTASPFSDTNVAGGSSPFSHMNYQVFSQTEHEVYETRLGGTKLNQSSGVTYGGCDFFDPYTKECAGWRGNPPTAFTIDSITIDSNSVDNVVSGLHIIDADGSFDKYVYTIKTAPTHGGAEVREGKIYYVPAPNYFGTDTFEVTAKDKAGNTISAPVNVQINCPAPVISAITVPNPFPGLTTQMAGVKYTANACNGTLSVAMKLFDVNTLQEIESLGQTRTGEANGVNRTTSFTFTDMEPGKYRVDAIVTSENNATNNNSKSLIFDVGNFGAYSLVMNKDIYTEDDLILANVKAAQGSCPIVDQVTARNDSKCYIVWSQNPMTDSAAKDPATLQGYALTGTDYQIRADVYKFDSHLVAHKVDSVNGTITVLPGLPTVLKEVKFAKPIVRWMDKFSFAFARDSGYDCQMKLTPEEALANVQAGQRTCLLEVTLPDGLTWTPNSTVPTVGGRIDQWSSESPNTKIHYKLSKYYVTKDPFLMAEGDVTIPVNNFELTPSLTQDRLGYAANSSKAYLAASFASKKPADATICTYTNREAEAGYAYANMAPPVCYVEWDTIPPGLSADTSSTSPKLAGMPTEIGDNPVGFSVYVIKPAPAGMEGQTTVRERIAQYSGTIKVTDLIPVSYTLTTPANGTITLQGEEVPRFLIGDDGKVGDIQIVGGDFSTIKMTVIETGSTPQTFTGLRNGEKRALSLAAGTKGAWLNREAQVRLEYEEIAVGTQQTYDISATQLPAQKVATAVVPPLVAPNDTDPFSMQAQVGLPGSGKQLQYTASRDGDWLMALYSKQGTTLVPMTDAVHPDTTGFATFSGLTYSSYVGQEIWAVSTMVPPEGSVMSIPIKQLVSPTGTKLTFVMGGAIQAPTALGRTTGPAPVKQTFDLKLNAEAAAALKSVIWYYSDDNMTTWKPVGVTGRGATYTFSKGGVYFVKGQMTNKYTNMTSWSEPASFTVVETLNATLDGEDLYLPSTPVTITLSAKTKDGLPMSDFNSRWEVIDSTGTPVTYEDVSKIDLASDVPQTYDITVMIKSKTMDAANPASWTTLTKKVVFFAPAKPKISVTGPRIVEVEKTGTFIAKLVKPWDAKLKTSLQMAGKWVLPDGTEVPGDTLNFSPKAEDGIIQKLQYKAWVVGMEAETTALYESSVAITSYIFPNFTFKPQVDTIYAPAYLRLTANPATPFDGQQVRGKKLTYTWTLPEGFDGTASGTSLRGIADTPGTYDFSLKVEDDRGNSQTLTYQLVLEQSRPWDFSVALVPAIKFNRNPMTYVVKPSLRGGHPKDRIQSVELLLDDAQVSQTPSYPRQVIIPTAGPHTVKLKVHTTMGQTVETTADVVVNQNQEPVCEFVEVWDKTGMNVKLVPNCTDVDGRVTRMVWYKDGVKLNKSSSYLFITVNSTTPTAQIKCELYDDAGAMVTLDHTVNYQP